MERRLVLPGLYEGFGLLALVASPFVSMILPHRFAKTEILPHTDLKDAINILLLIGFVIFIIARLLFLDIVALLRWGPSYRQVSHNFFYLEDGTVLVRSTFVLLAGWDAPIAALPEEGFLWFKDIDRDKIHYRLVQRGSVSARAIAGDLPRIVPRVLQFERTDMATNALSWQPSISPPLRRKEAITYQVEVLTPGTETAAFEPAGTTMGFGVSLPTGTVTLQAYAPIGYEFVLVKPCVSIRDFTSAAPLPSRPGDVALPVISPDGTIVTLARRHPRPRRRTWVHYRFEQLKGGAARGF